METPSRRDVLAVAAVTVSLPLLESALGRMRAAQAAAPAAGAGRGGPPEKAGWFSTTVKPADVKENEFTLVDGHKIVLARTGKDVSAMTSICTHRGCAMTPTAGQKTLTCKCHNSAFNLDGTVAKGPATRPIDHYAIRVNDKGEIEVDPGQKLAKDAKGATYTIS